MWYTVRRTVRGPTSADFLLFWPPVCPWMNWSCAVICSLSIPWWDHNVSITFVVACGLPRLTLGYELFSHHCIPQARGMCSVCPKNDRLCSSLCVKTPVLEMVWLCEWETLRDAKGVWACLTGCKEKLSSSLWGRETDRDTNYDRAD